MSKEMTPKDALEKLNNFISREKHIDSERNKTINKCVDTLNQALDRLELLEKIFSDSHICEIKARFNEIECSADKCDNCPLGIGDGICLKNTFEKKWELQKENQALRDKLNINFEECADELCEALTQRDKLYDENLELKKENQELENKNAALKIKVRAWEIQGKKYKKAIDILKNTANIRLHILTNNDGSKIYEIEFIFTYYSTIHEITKQEYDLLKEVLENE